MSSFCVKHELWEIEMVVETEKYFVDLLTIFNFPGTFGIQ
jgi:hypothetical protein